MKAKLENGKVKVTNYDDGMAEESALSSPTKTGTRAKSLSTFSKTRAKQEQ